MLQLLVVKKVEEEGHRSLSSPLTVDNRTAIIDWGEPSAATDGYGSQVRKVEPKGLLLFFWRAIAVGDGSVTLGHFQRRPRGRGEPWMVRDLGR